MPRLNIQAGEALDIPETEPVLITGWLISNPPGATEDAVLTGADPNGDVFTALGMRLRAEYLYGGADLKARVDPTCTIALTGDGASATVYYERLKWIVDYGS